MKNKTKIVKLKHGLRCNNLQRGQQDCLTSDMIGPARAAETICIGDEKIHEGDIINPPENDGGMKTL